jgi:hypothetical protein
VEGPEIEPDIATSTELTWHSLGGPGMEQLGISHLLPLSALNISEDGFHTGKMLISFRLGVLACQKSRAFKLISL